MAHKLLIDIDMFSSTPLYLQVTNGITRYVESGMLMPGERLPSLRALAKQLRLSVDTIRQAISVLLSNGLIVSRPGSGYYISRTAPQPEQVENKSASQSPGEQSKPAHKLQLSEEGQIIEKLSGQLACLNESAMSAPYDFRLGEPVLELLQGPRLTRSLKRWGLESLAGSSLRGDVAGLPDLRGEVAVWLKRTRGIDCSPDEIFLTANDQQSRDLLASLLTNRGAEVLVEKPGHIRTALTYRAHGAKLIAIDLASTSAGLAQEGLAEAHVVHLHPAAGCLSGSSMTMARRQEILAWAQRHDVTIVEDSSGEGYSYDGRNLPSLMALARQTGSGARVIYMGSLSQHLPANLAVSYVIVPGWLRDAFYRAKWLAERYPSLILQELVLNLMTGGVFEQHCLRLLESMRRRRQAVLSALSQWPADLVSYMPVEAGFQQPIWLLDGVDDVRTAEAALSQGVAIAPISPWLQDETAQSGLALCFARMSEDAIRAGMDRLLSIVRGEHSSGQAGIQSFASEVADTPRA